MARDVAGRARERVALARARACGGSNRPPQPLERRRQQPVDARRRTPPSTPARSSADQSPAMYASPKPILPCAAEPVEEGVAMDRQHRRLRPAAAACRLPSGSTTAQRQRARGAQEERAGDPRARGAAAASGHGAAGSGLDRCVTTVIRRAPAAGGGGRRTRATPRSARRSPWRWMRVVTLAVISGWRTSIRATAAFVNGRRRPVSDAANTRSPPCSAPSAPTSRSPGGGERHPVAAVDGQKRRDVELLVGLGPAALARVEQVAVTLAVGVVHLGDDAAQARRPGRGSRRPRAG